MNISLSTPDSPYFIRRYQPGCITLNTSEHRSSLIIHGKTLIDNWAPQSIQSLSADDIKMISEQKPHLVILGTGEQQHFPAADLLAPLYQAQIGVEIMSTEAACKTYNILAGEGRDVLAALIVR